MNEPNWDMYGKLDEDGYAIRPPVNDPPVYNCNRSLAWLAAHGYEEHDEDWWEEHARPTPAYTRQRCTKYQLVTCLRNHFPALLPTLRTAYAANADLQFYWNTVNDLDRNNADFKTAQAALGITDAQVAEIFEKIEGTEPAAVTE